MGKLSYGATGIAYEPTKTGEKMQGAPRCPKCNDRVYFNEEKKALGKTYHSRCFCCKKCNKRLESMNFSNHEEDIYCNPCYRREFSTKGVAASQPAAAATTTNGDGPKRMTTDASGNIKPVAADKVHSAVENLTNGTVGKDDPQCCPRCSKRVYFAEEINALHKKWHKLCFKCGVCSKMLEPGKCNEHCGDVFCPACYGKKFGPKGYGFAGGSGTMMAPDEKVNGTVNGTNGTSEPLKETSNIQSQIETVEIPETGEIIESVRISTVVEQPRTSLSGQQEEWVEAVTFQ